MSVDTIPIYFGVLHLTPMRIFAVHGITVGTELNNLSV